MPCFSGVMGIREKRLHCRNDPEHEGWRKGRAYARPQGRKSLGAQEKIGRGLGAVARSLGLLTCPCGFPYVGVWDMHPSPPIPKEQGLIWILGRSQEGSFYGPSYIYQGSASPGVGGSIIVAVAAGA